MVAVVAVLCLVSACVCTSVQIFVQEYTSLTRVQFEMISYFTEPSEPHTCEHFYLCFRRFIFKAGDSAGSVKPTPEFGTTTARYHRQLQVDETGNRRTTVSITMKNQSKIKKKIHKQ